MKSKISPPFSRKNALFLAGSITVLFSLPTMQAADRIKANNATDLNLAGSWNTLPGLYDVANWTSTVTGANTVALGANLNWQGIKIVGPGGLVTISSGNTLTLGERGIDLSAATQDLTIQSGLALQSYSGQVWNIATGRTLTLNTGLFTRNRYSTLNVLLNGTGAIATTNISNDATGIIGSWASFGTGTSYRYATVNGSNNIVAYTGGTSATAATVTSTTGLVNYDVTAVGTLGSGASFNTLRYTGAVGTIAGGYSANGIMNAGTGALTLSGNLNIGSSREVVLSAPDSTRTLVLSGSISDNVRGSSSVTIGGSSTGGGTVTLSGNNTYTGATTVARGALILNSNNGLGSTDAGTRLTPGGNAQYSNGGYLELANGVNSPEPIYLDSTLSQNMIKTTGSSGSATLSGPVRMNNSIRPAGNFNINFTGGLSTANGAAGTYIILNSHLTILNKPFINGSGYLATDQTQTRVFGVAGNMYGGIGNGAGTIRTDVPYALSYATQSFGLGGGNPGNSAVFDLNGNNQLVTEFKSGGYVVVGQERTLTSTNPASLTIYQTTTTTSDAKITGALSIIKNSAAGANTLGTLGTLNYSGFSTTTGSITVNGGTFNENFGRANASVSGAGTVSNSLLATTPLILGGGTFQLTGRQDGTVPGTPITGGTWASGVSEITGLSSTAGLAPGQLISSATAGIPAGTYIVSIETGLVGSGNRIAISANTTAAGSGATITPTANSYSSSQTLGGVTLNPGASGVTVSANGAATPATVLNLGAITRNPGSMVRFTLPTGTQSSTNGITTTTGNDSTGILGTYAFNGSGASSYYSTVSSGNIINYTGGTTAATAAAITDTTGAVNYNVSAVGALGAGTSFNTLRYTGSAGTITGASSFNGILNSGTGALALSGAQTIGAGKELVVIAADTTRNVTLSGIISDNAGGASGITTGGAGVIALGGTNTYTGKTVINGSGIVNATDRLEIAAEANLGTTPASFVADQLTFAGGTLRNTAAVSLSANRGITVTAANGIFDMLGSALTINGVISGTGNLTKSGQSGAGALVLNAANTFSGFFLNYATGNFSQLQLGNVNALQNATLDTGGSNNQSVVFSVAGTNTYNLGGLQGADQIALGANSISVGANNMTTSYTGVITGTGGLTKVGTGTLQFTGANTYSGDTVVSGGMLVLAHANAIQSSTLDTGSAGSQSVNLTQIEGTTYNIGGLKGTADLDMAMCNLSIGANNQSTTYNGVLKGAFGNNLTKVGSGKLTLTGANTYTGTTAVSTGSLQVGETGSGQTGTGAVNVAGGATLLGTGVVRGETVTFNASSAVRPGDTVADSSFGTLTFTPVGTGSYNLAANALASLGIGTATTTDATFGGNAVGSVGYNTWVDGVSGVGGHDRLAFNGTTGSTLAFSGNLSVIASSYTAQLGDVFNLLDLGANVTADFSGFVVGANRNGSGDNGSQFDLPDISASGYLWDVSRFTTSGNIVVIPEPSQLMLCGLGLAGLALRRRR